MNYTLGLGENQIRVHVVLMSGPVPRILNTYIILIGRQARGIPQFRPSLRVCQLTQVGAQLDNHYYCFKIIFYDLFSAVYHVL